MAKDKTQLKKDAFDLEGNVIRTTEEEEAIAREQLETQRAKKEADKGTKPDAEAAERKRFDLEGKEIVDEVEAEAKVADVASDTTTEEAETTSSEDEESKDKSESGESVNTKESESEDAGDSSDDSESKESGESEDKSTEEKPESTDKGESTSESDVEDESKKSDEKVEEKIDDKKEVGDFDTRLTKMEEKLDKVLTALAKSSSAEEETKVDAEAEAVEADTKEDASTDNASKSEKSDMKKVDTDAQIAKLEGDLNQAQQDLEKKAQELEELKKMAKPSKILSPFAVAKGIEFYSEPEKELTQISEKLAKFDEIQKSRPLTEAEQKEAYKLVKTKKDIQYQLS